MKNIIKSIIASLLVAIVFVACNNDADREWTTPEATFKLYNTSLTSNVLYTSMENNPISFIWDKPSGATGSYKLQMSDNKDFASNVLDVAESDKNSYETTVGAFNKAVLSLGLNPYTSQKVYLRIVNGTQVSNPISFDVTPYPVVGPMITAPTANSTIALNTANQTATAITVTWKDYTSYGVDVKYLVEVAKRGSTDFVTLGEVTNVKMLDVSNKTLNTAALNAGASVNVLTELDFRVTAKSQFSTPGIVLVSSIVTAKLTPYQVDYPNFFLVGAASAAGWSDTGAQQLYKHDNTSEIYTYMQPGNFRFLGQQAWNPLNYSVNLPETNAGSRYFNSVSSNVAFGDAENMKFTGPAGIYKVVIDADFGKKSLTITPTTASWDVPNLYLAGSIQGWNAATALPFQAKGNGLFESDPLEIADGSEFKFLGQQDWTGKEWGNIHKDNLGNSGFLGINDDNSNIKFDGGNNFYIITVDLKKGTYKLVKL